MPFMSALLGDFLGGPGGFNETSEGIRKSNQRDAEAERERESKVLEHLANSDDPEIRAAAVTGMLTRGGKSTGLDKWFGKQQQHPAFPIISSLVGAGHQPFASPEEKTKRETRGRVSGELEGRAGFAEQRGAKYTPEELKELADPRATPRRLTTYPLNVKYYDENGEVQTTTVDYDQNEQGDARFQKNGKSFGYEIVAQSRGNFTEPNAYRGAGRSTVKDTGQYPGETTPTGYWRVNYDANMKELGHAPGATAPPVSSEFIGGPVQTGTGFSGMTKGGTLRPLKPEGGGPPPAPGVTPQTDVEQIDRDIARVDAIALKRIGTGNLAEPEKLPQYRDEEAVLAKYKNYEDMRKRRAAAAAVVSGRVQKPAAAKKPSPTSGNIVDEVLQEYMRGRGGRGAPPPPK